MITKLFNWKSEKIQLLKQLEEKDKAIIKLIDDVNNLKWSYELPLTTSELINFYDNKYLNKNITYKGLIIKFLNKEIKPSILVCDYIHITESMRRWIIENGFQFNMEPTPENISKHSWEIYSEFIKYKMYKLDIQLFGQEERWASNFEQTYIKEKEKWLGDCENLANYCLGLILASGVPRGLVRITAGNCSLGGHASLTCWDWRTGKFEQWETTAREPTVLKTTDPTYISTVWFSYDNEKAWSNLDRTKYNKIKAQMPKECMPESNKPAFSSHSLGRA